MTDACTYVSVYGRSVRTSFRVKERTFFFYVENGTLKRSWANIEREARTRIFREDISPPRGIYGYVIERKGIGAPCRTSIEKKTSNERRKYQLRHTYAYNTNRWKLPAVEGVISTSGYV